MMRKPWLPLTFLAGLVPLLTACAAIDEQLGGELGADVWPIVRTALIAVVSLCTILILIVLVILISRMSRARRKPPAAPAPTGRTAEIATTIPPMPQAPVQAAQAPVQAAQAPARAAPAPFAAAMTSAAETLPAVKAVLPDAPSAAAAYALPEPPVFQENLVEPDVPAVSEAPAEPPTDPGILPLVSTVPAVIAALPEEPAQISPQPSPDAPPEAPEAPLPAYDPYPLLEALQAPALLGQVNKFKLASMGQIYTIPSGYALEWLSPAQKACSVLILALSPETLQVNDQVIPADAARLKSAIAAALRAQLT